MDLVLVELGPNAGAFKALNSDALDLPQLGAEIYIELDYKCDSEFGNWLQNQPT